MVSNRLASYSSYKIRLILKYLFALREVVWLVCVCVCVCVYVCVCARMRACVCVWGGG